VSGLNHTRLKARSPGVLVLDAIDNVERVIIRGGTFPSGTSLAVDVMAYSLPQPSQDFALVAENAGE
jgi:hypothetical protein